MRLAACAPTAALHQREQHEVGRPCDATPMTREPNHLTEQRPGCGRQLRRAELRGKAFTGIEPLAKPRNIRPMPLRSAVAVAMMSTRLSGSSTQSTGHLVDTQAAALGEHQQFGVEEPAGVRDMRQQPLGDVGADGLEAALRVGKARGQRGLQDQVVAARDDLTLGPAHHPRRRGPAGCRSPGPSDRRPAARPAARAPSRSVDRSTSM